MRLAGRVAAAVGATSTAVVALVLVTAPAGPDVPTSRSAVVDPMPVEEVATATRLGGPAPDPVWVTGTAARTGVPLRALQAYASAALALTEEQPDCHVGWTTLAAIGEVESGHGGVLDDDGRPTTPVVGVPLDGTGGHAAVRSGEGWDRARGPVQFIESTWRTWGADGDGDGVADVHDLDDAALAAARYLCAAGDLSTGAAWSRAVFSYNHSDVYVEQVRAVARRLGG